MPDHDVLESEVLHKVRYINILTYLPIWKYATVFSVYYLSNKFENDRINSKTRADGSVPSLKG